jgi:hypothetical protein
MFKFRWASALEVVWRLDEASDVIWVWVWVLVSLVLLVWETWGDLMTGVEQPRSFPRLATPTPQVKVVR